MRDGFRAAVSGWTLTSNVEDLGKYIEEAGRYAAVNGLEPGEEATVELMVKCQVARGLRRGDFLPYLTEADVDL